MPRRAEFALLLGIVLAFVIGVLAGIAVNTAFGYDESVYAVAARYVVSATPASGWDVHRPPLLSALGLLPTLIGGQEWQFRLVGTAFGTATMVAVWSLGRAVAGPAVGLVAALAVGAAAAFQLQSGVFLTDVPSTFVLLVLTAFLWRELSSTEPIGRSFVWLAPLAATAFYLRYGTIIALVGLGIGAAVVGGQRLRDGWRWVGMTILALVVLTVPHMIVATISRGAPWGFIAQAGSVVTDAEGLPLMEYLGWLPWTLFGPLGGLMTVLAAGMVLLRVTRIGRHTVGGDDRPARFVAFAGLAAGVQILVYGTVIHAEPRYLLFPMILLVLVGAKGLVDVADRLPSKAPLAIAGAAVLLALGVVTGISELRQRAASHDWTREVGLAIGGASDGECSILTSDVPIMSWYSGCDAYGFAASLGVSRLPLLHGADRFIVLRQDGLFQPNDEFVEANYLPHATLIREFHDGFGRPVAKLYLATDAPP